ncbi:HTH-type transcriptional repressor AcnR [Antarctobacter heliothermus]|uniref:HTH-type transcriptional repressor AcnR n=1 Tax=Antarctobacter heliothermus TaxID=74033 RepID=A0A222E2I9_9RHOB|nr:TetR/AcrR family transcriptional regulator [Antarctobacter heliothermus]ASP20383.1 HTH-type transcriptional repressor AcnR [Antarctobacter heliothermus]
MKKTSIVKDRAATEARILNAARAVFARRGYDAAGLREIAEAAQANLSLISRYFGGKEGLLTALTDQFVASRREGKLSYPPQDTLEDEIYSYLHEKLRDDLKDEDIVRLIVSRAAIDAEFREKGRVHSDGLADENFRIRVGRLQDNGKVSPDINIDLLFAGVMHVSFSVNFFGAIVAGRPDTEIDALFHGFAAALAQGFPVRH